MKDDRQVITGRTVRIESALNALSAKRSSLGSVQYSGISKGSNISKPNLDSKSCSLQASVAYIFAN